MKDPRETTKARIARLEARVAELERDRYGVGGLLERVFPPDIRERVRAAQREQLVTVRSFIDRWLERTEHRPKHQKVPVRRGTKRA